MINTSVFNYVNILDKAADASWLRNEAISNNIANATTPGYKRQDVSFESELKSALGRNRYGTLSSKVSGVNAENLSPSVYVDYSNYSYRLDGNNVDIENENIMLAQNQLKYQGLIMSMSQEFSNLQMVMK